MNLTKAQQAALNKLVAGIGTLPAKKSFRDEPIVKTGCNTTVLHSLRDKGLITFDQGYLYGWVTADLTITALGHSLVK